MTEHLPECHLWLEPMLSEQDWCICARLRACEQRTLDAAREAVAAIAEAQTSERSPWELVVVDDAVAAIDALRGDR